MKKLVALTAAVATAGSLAIPAYAGSRTVSVKDDFFSPKSLTVSKGTTLKFRFVGEAPHNVKFTGKKAFATIGTRSSGTISRKANTRGTFKLVCTIHSGMTGRLTVK